MTAHGLFEGPAAKRPRYINNGYPQHTMPSYDQQFNSLPHEMGFNFPTMNMPHSFNAFFDGTLNSLQNVGVYQQPMYSMLQNSRQTDAMCLQRQPAEISSMNQQTIHRQLLYSDLNMPSTSEQMPQQNIQMQSMAAQSNYAMQYLQSAMPMINPMVSKMNIYQQAEPAPQPLQAMQALHDQFLKSRPEGQVQQPLTPNDISEQKFNPNPSPEYVLPPMPTNEFKNPQTVSPDMMRQFLTNMNFYACSLTIHVPKAAQKSYKTEKRFVVPPPTVMLEGQGWSNNGIVPGGFGLENGSLRATMRVSQVQNTEKELEKTTLSDNKLLLTAKSMFISTDEKKKMITLTTDISPTRNFCLGPVVSERIKVMSKPSKKKQTSVGPEARYLSIQSKSRIALYNRLRSQNISTRFFYVDEQGRPEASSNQWSVLEIILIRSFSDTETELPNFQQQQNGFNIDTKDGNINYGDIVILRDVETGIALPLMRIRKTLKTGNAYHTKEETSGEPVSQLHMVVFEFLEDHHMYLHANPEYLKKCSGAQTQNESVSVNDGCRWTIISAEATTHKFAPLCGLPVNPIAPLPVVWEVEDMAVQLDKHRAIELRGSFGFNNVKVWFGIMKSPKTLVRSSENIVAMIPPLDHYHTAYPPEIRNHPDIKKRALLINLVRDDGVVYTTEFVFEYNLKSVGPLGRVLTTDSLVYE